MKTLFINRHAKSDWGNAELRDFDRPLNQRGESDAQIMGKRLIERGERIDLFLSSPANRALSTAQTMAELHLNDVENIVTDQRIYHAELDVLLQVINQLDDTYSAVIMFGHNPGFSCLAEYLTDQHFDNLPTCSLVKVTFSADSWQEISKHSGLLEYFDFPKNEVNLI